MKDLIKKATRDSLAHGFKGREHPSFKFLTQAACEVGEAVDAYKRNRRADVRGYQRALNTIKTLNEKGPIVIARTKDAYDVYVKDTVQDELSDVYIYLLVMAGHFLKPEDFDNLDFEEIYTKAEMKKRLLEDTFISVAGNVMRDILTMCVTARNVSSMLAFLELWTKLGGFGDLPEYVKLKMEYNRTRPYLHGIKGDPTA